MRAVLIALVLAGCTKAFEPLTSVVPMTGAVPSAAIEYRDDPVAVRAFERTPDGTTEPEILRALCTVRTGDYQATVETPAGVLVPVSSGRPPVIEVGCTHDGYAPGRASVPARRDRVIVQENGFGGRFGVGYGSFGFGVGFPEYHNVYLDTYSYPTARVLMSRR